MTVQPVDKFGIHLPAKQLGRSNALFLNRKTIFMKFLIIILGLALFALAAEEERRHQIPDGFGGIRMVTEQEYNRWYTQQRQMRQRQQMQQQIQNQLQSIKSGGGGGGGGGGGSGGGSGGGKSSSNANSIKPLDTSAFGQIPNFSSNPSQKALEELVTQSAKPDAASSQFLDEIKKQIEESAKRSELPQTNTDTVNLSDFNLLLLKTMAAIRAIPNRNSIANQLLQSATAPKRRRIVGRPLEVPSGGGLVAGRSQPTILFSQSRLVSSPGASVDAGSRRRTTSNRVRSLSSHR